MSFQQALTNAIQLAPLNALANDVRATLHKARYPMAAILAKVPGESLAARARAIGVSRQTMYVWAQERFRPSGEQAETIAALTGVPMVQIKEYQEGNNGGASEPARKTITRMGKAGRKLPGGAARLRAKRRGMVSQQGKR